MQKLNTSYEPPRTSPNLYLIPLLITILFFSFSKPIQAADDCTEGDDRCSKYHESKELGREKTDEILEQRKMQHEMKQMQHEEKAQQAEQQQDYGTAQQERKKAMMEMQKVQQLQQQITKNHETSDKNKDSRDKLRKSDEPKGKQKGYDAKVVSVRKKSNESMAPSDLIEDEPPPQLVPSKEVASFSDYDTVSPSSSYADFSPTSPTANDTKGSEVDKLLTELEDMGSEGHLRLGYDENVDKGGGMGSPKLTSSASGGSGGSTAAAQSRLLSSATGGGDASSSGSSDTNIWKASPKNEEGKEEKDTKSTNPSVSPQSSGRLLASVSGRSMIPSGESKDTMDKDFFEQCPYDLNEDADAPDDSESKKLSPRCEKFVTRCRSEIEEWDQWEKQTEKEKAKSSRRGKKAELSDDCSKWQQFYAAKEEKEVDKVQKLKKGSTPNKGKRTARKSKR